MLYRAAVLATGLPDFVGSGSDKVVGAGVNVALLKTFWVDTGTTVTAGLVGAGSLAFGVGWGIESEDLC